MFFQPERYVRPVPCSRQYLNRVRQPQQLNAIQRHVHLVGIKYCEDTRPGQKLEAAQWQHADFCKNVSGKAMTLHIILLGVGGTCYNGHIDQLKISGLDHRQASKLASELHTHSVKYAQKL
eukprot:242313-Pelagomonas_calceolata.AAC.1